MLTLVYRVPYGEEDERDYPISDLQERFLGLTTSGGTAGRYHDITYNTDPGEDVDELLAELRQNIAQNPSEDRELETHLVREAKSFLASSSRLAGAAPREQLDDKDRVDQEVEKDAKAYVDRVLDEVRHERHDDSERRPASNSEPEREREQPRSPENNDHSPPSSPFTKASSALNLPDTPSKLLPLPTDEDGPRSPAENLPAPPTFAPDERPVRIKGWTGANDPVPTTWCCICNDDAQIKCMDCDEQMFCPRCWREMHFEEGTEEERRHRAVSLWGGGGWRS